MSVIGKFIIFIFEECISLTNNFVIDLLIFSVLETIAHLVAYIIVGKCSNLLLNDSKLMSVLHWIIRIIILVVTSVVVILILRVINVFI